MSVETNDVLPSGMMLDESEGTEHTDFRHNDNDVCLYGLALFNLG